MSRSKSTITNLIFGGITIISIASIIFYFWRSSSIFKSKQNKTLTEKFNIHENLDKNDEERVEDEEDDDETVDNEYISDPQNTPINNDELQLEKIKEIKEEYDTCCRLASKLLAGQSYDKAAQKYTEAIELASQIPSASSNIKTLYNNRSAMYEKIGEYEKALNDITVVLAMENHHLKAKTRRAKIYEAQGKYRESLNDYIFGMMVEQSQGISPSNLQKIDEICKKIARDETTSIVQEMRKCVGRPLPPKCYCRNFFESLPSIHSWRLKYTRNTDR